MADDFCGKRTLVIILSSLALLLVGCQAAAPLPDPTEFPQAVVMQYTPGVRILTPVLVACAAEDPDLALFLEETPKPALDLDPLPDRPLRLGLALGEPPEQSYAATLSDVQIAVITHPSNPVHRLSAAELQALFSGQIQNWIELGGSDQAVTPWALTPADESRQLFENVILSESKISGQTRLAADPAWMLAEVSVDPGAVGYLPAAWLNEGVQAAGLEPALAEGLRLPLLGLAANEPQGAARRLLICLQSGSGQQLLSSLLQVP